MEIILGLGIAVAILTLPALIGYMLGKALFRIPDWSIMLLCLFGLSFILYTLINSMGSRSTDTAFFCLVGFVSWVCFIAAATAGQQLKRTQDLNERRLAAWYERLVADEMAPGSRLKVAFDCSHVAAAFTALGRKEEAVLFYQRAYSVVVDELGDHPHAREMLQNYARALRAVNKSEEAQKVEAEAKAIASPDDIR